jgi:hypothetical protein
VSTWKVLEISPATREDTVTGELLGRTDVEDTDDEENLFGSVPDCPFDHGSCSGGGSLWRERLEHSYIEHCPHYRGERCDNITE